MKFTQKTIQPIKEVNKEKKATRFFKRALYFFIICLLLWATYSTYEFVNTHDFRTPIILQDPFPRRTITIESPIGSKSALLIRSAYAEEVKNPYNSKSPKGIAWEAVKKEFGIENWEAFDNIVTNESGWNPYAKNVNGGACGLGQSLPCSKMDCEKWDYECQVDWVIKYIKNRYHTPIEAWKFWQNKNWY